MTTRRTLSPLLKSVTRVALVVTAPALLVGVTLIGPASATFVTITTPTGTGSPSASASPTDTSSPSASPTDTGSPSASASPTPTDTSSPSASASPTPTDTSSPSASASPSDTSSPSASPTDTSSPSASPSDTGTPSPTPTDTGTPTASASPTAAPQPPTEPLNVAASQTGPNSATISWAPPASPGGSAITGYDVGLATANQGNGASYSSTTRTVTFDNLVVGITYTLSVAATNTDGPGPRIFRDVTISSPFPTPTSAPPTPPASTPTPTPALTPTAPTTPAPTTAPSSPAPSASPTLTASPTPSPTGAPGSHNNQTVQGGGGIRTSAVGGSRLTSSADGTGSLTEGWYTSPPAGIRALRVGTRYFDLFVSPGSALTRITSTICPAAVADSLEWYQASTATWHAVRPVVHAGNCAVLTLSSTSSPTIAQLTGTVFGVVAAFPAPVLTQTNSHGVVTFTLTVRPGTATSALAVFSLKSGLTHRVIRIGTGRVNAQGVATLRFVVRPGRQLFAFAGLDHGTGLASLTTNAIAFRTVA